MTGRPMPVRLLTTRLMGVRLIRLALPPLIGVLLAGVLLLLPSQAWAGPVSWVEVPPTAEGRQWWDVGSLRINRAGNLTVLSRFEAAPAPDAPGAPASAAASAAEGVGASGDGRGGDGAALAQAPAGTLPAAGPQETPGSRRSASAIGRLYVMELDCDQGLYRDISVNGLPRFGAEWQPTGSDDLTAEVLRQACAAEAA